MAIMSDDFIGNGRLHGALDGLGDHFSTTHGVHEVLTGTDGADTFTVSPDEGQTEIVDFTPGSDTIDLSQLPSGAKVELISMFGRTIILVASSDLPHGLMEITVQGQVAPSDMILPTDARLVESGHAGGAGRFVPDPHPADTGHMHPIEMFPDHPHGDYFFG